MRLLDTRTGHFLWAEDPKQTSYAILSHVWSREPGSELTYQDMIRIQSQVLGERIQDPNILEDAVLSRLSPKVHGACERARADGIDLIWIDSACIDKSSSAELNEAINSMYSWYGSAKVCHAFLHDVDSGEDPSSPDSTFRRSVWFTRGWTLQELIAPELVVFFASNWRPIGGKHGLAGVIEESTGINRTALVHQRPLSSFTVAQRMFWASTRVTTRIEDEAYCLMGLFDVNLPTIYGEGRKAFLRLQEEILRTVPDQTIFVWDYSSNLPMTPRHYDANEDHALLATSPRAFTVHSANVRTYTSSFLANILSSWCSSGDSPSASKQAFISSPGQFSAPLPAYIMTPYGIRVTLPFVRFKRLANISAVPLACKDRSGYLIMLLLKNVARSNHVEGLCVVGSEEHPWHHRLSTLRRWPTGGPEGPVKLVTVQIRQLQEFSSIAKTEFYIAHRSSLVASLLEEQRPTKALKDAILADMSSNSPQFQMVVHPGPLLQLAKLGYTSSFTDGNILHVSCGAHKAAIVFYLTDIQRYDPQARLDRVVHVLFASYEATTPVSLPHHYRGPRPATDCPEPASRTTVGESLSVEAWDRALGRANTSLRSRTFLLPPRNAGVEPGGMCLTVTRESPGSAEYPSVFSLGLMIEVPGLPELPSSLTTRDDGSSRNGYGECRPGGIPERRASMAATESSRRGGGIVRYLRSRIFGGASTMG